MQSVEFGMNADARVSFEDSIHLEKYFTGIDFGMRKESRTAWMRSNQER
jgi:hypothetical protein